MDHGQNGGGVQVHGAARRGVQVRLGCGGRCWREDYRMEQRPSGTACRVAGLWRHKGLLWQHVRR